MHPEPLEQFNPPVGSVTLLSNVKLRLQNVPGKGACELLAGTVNQVIKPNPNRDLKVPVSVESVCVRKSYESVRLHLCPGGVVAAIVLNSDPYVIACLR